MLNNPVIIGSGKGGNNIILTADECLKFINSLADDILVYPKFTSAADVVDGDKTWSISASSSVPKALPWMAVNHTERLSDASNLLQDGFGYGWLSSASTLPLDTHLTVSCTEPILTKGVILGYFNWTRISATDTGYKIQGSIDGVNFTDLTSELFLPPFINGAYSYTQTQYAVIQFDKIERYKYYRVQFTSRPSSTPYVFVVNTYACGVIEFGLIKATD